MPGKKSLDCAEARKNANVTRVRIWISCFFFARKLDVKLTKKSKVQTEFKILHFFSS